MTTSDKKSKVTVTLTRTEADWLLSLLERESRSNTEGDPACHPSSGGRLSPSRAKYGFTAGSLAERIRAEG